MAKFHGTDGVNKFDGTHHDDAMFGKGGDDRLEGNKGNDTLYGGEGNDFIQGGDGKDTIWGGEGNDKLFGGRGDDVLSDRHGTNFVDGGHGTDIFMLDGKREDYRFEYVGDRTVVVTKVNDTQGTEFKATLKDIEIIRFRNEDVNHDFETGKLGNTVPDTEMTIHEAINGCYQNIADFENTKTDVTVDGITYDYHYQDVRDTVGDGGVGNGGEGEDNCFIGGGDMGEITDESFFIQGSAGNDKIGGNNGNDRLQGGAGDDRMWGNGGDDIMRGGKGNDTVKGGEGNDRIRGCEGDDYVSGEQGDDIIFGGKGNDEVDGGAGNDILYGGAGDDVIFGDALVFPCAGDDILVDEEGTNTINGGAGKDTYVLKGSLEEYDFDLQEDGSVIVTRKEGFDGPDFQTTLINVEHVVFDATDRNLEGNHLQNFVDNAFENGTVYDIYEDLAV